MLRNSAQQSKYILIKEGEGGGGMRTPQSEMKHLQYPNKEILNIKVEGRGSGYSTPEKIT